MNNLPYEVLFSIATHIDSPRDLYSFSRVSTLFLSVSRDDRIWKRLCYQLYNLKPSLTEMKQSFYELFTKILVPYGRYLGYWKSNELYFGGLIYVYLNLSDGNIIGEKIVPFNANHKDGQLNFDEDDEDENESSLQPLYMRTKLFTIDTRSDKIYCFECNMPHPELRWIKTFDRNKQHFGLSQEALPINERSSLILHDHDETTNSDEQDLYFIQRCSEHSTILYHPISLPQPTIGDNNHPLSRLNGFWVGSYGGHGLELLYLEFYHELTCPPVADDPSTGEEVVSNVLVARKISGDRNIPHGKISFAAVRPLENESDSPPAYEGIGQIAHTGYQSPQFIRTKVVLLSNDTVSVTWYALHHTSFFKRCIF